MPPTLDAVRTVCPWTCTALARIVTSKSLNIVHLTQTASAEPVNRARVSDSGMPQSDIAAAYRMPSL